MRPGTGASPEAGPGYRSRLSRRIAPTRKTTATSTTAGGSPAGRPSTRIAPMKSKNGRPLATVYQSGR